MWSHVGREGVGRREGEGRGGGGESNIHGGRGELRIPGEIHLFSDLTTLKYL